MTTPGPEPERTGGGGVSFEGPLPLVVLVCAVGVVVAIGAGGLRLLLPAAPLGATATWGVRALGAAAVAAGVAGLLAQQKRLRAASGSQDPTLAALRTAGITMATITLVALLVWPPAPRNIESVPFPLRWTRRALRHPPPGDSVPPPSYGGDAAIRGTPTELPGIEAVVPPDGEPLSQRLRMIVAQIVEFLLLALVLVTGILALMRRFGFRRRGWGVEEAFPVTPADAEESLEASLEEVAGTAGDPRGQITMAYRRLLSALTAAGAPRLPQEAPHEHLYRTLGPLGVHPEPLHRLTELYVVAHFSGRPVMDRHRAEAAEALASSLADLRAVHALPERDEPGPLVEVRT